MLSKSETPPVWWLLFMAQLMVLHSTVADEMAVVPSFIKHPPSKFEFSNSTGGKILCSASGTPNPTVEWLLSDDSPVTNVSGIRYVAGDGTLSFPSFKAENFRQDVHSTVYKCIATNSLGSITSGLTRVRGVVMHPYDIYVYDVYTIKGNTAVFRCNVPNFLSDFIKDTAWIRDSVVLITSNAEYQSNAKYSLLPNGDLYIHNVDTNDGLTSYQCQTMNHLTKEKKRSITAGTLIVTVPQGNIAPTISKSEKSVITKENGTSFLTCVAQGYPSPIVKWFKKSMFGNINEAVEESHRVLRIADSLLIKHVEPADGGIYICVASNFAGKSEAEVELIVRSSLSVSLKPQIQIANIGQSETLTCDITGSLPYSINWYKDGKELPMEGIRIKDNRTLFIDEMKTFHKGLYQCFAENDLISNSALSIIKLGDVLPSITKTLKEQINQPGTIANLHCVVNGIPLPTITWKQDGIVVKENLRIKIENKNKAEEVSSQLTIKNLKVEDGGTYSCIANNKAGSVESKARLNVYGNLQSRSRPKIISINEQNVQLSCPFYGYPFEAIVWHRDGVKLPEEFRQEILDNGNLQIQNVQRQTDNGKYTCSVIKNNKIEVTAEVELVVMVPPKILPFFFQDDLIREGARAQIQCVVSEGDPPMKLTWQKDGLTISNDMNIITRNIDEFSSILMISAITPKHNGNYTCIASNEAASTSHTAYLFVNVPPKIIPFSFQDDQFFKGMRAHIICAVSQGDLPIHFEWLKDGKQMSPDLGVTTRNVDDHANSLSIESVSSAHTGNYTCIASNEATTISYTAQLFVYVAPKIIPFSFRDADVMEGVLARLSCVVYQGDLPIEINWIKDTKPVTEFQGVFVRRIDEYSSILTIEKVQRNHTGNYTCVASNAADTVSHTTELQVKVPPKIVPFAFQDGNVLEGTLVRVTCVISRGDLPLVITWQKDGQPIANDSLITIRAFDEYSSVLSIDPVQARHKGNYTCIARNHAATVSYAAQLLVQVRPRWVIIPQDVVRASGEDASIDCQAEGLPKPSITWMKVEGRGSNKKRTDISNFKNTKVFSNGTLVIRNVTKNDSGDFFCVASNGVGVPLSKAIELTIKAPPTLNNKSSSIRVRKGNNATLICSTTGDIPMEFSWRIGEQFVPVKDPRFSEKQANRTDRMGAQSELTIFWIDRKDSHWYTCHVKNAYGTAKLQIQLIVEEVPEVPSFSNYKVTNKSVELNWTITSDGNSPIKRFTIQYKRKSDNWQGNIKSVNLEPDVRTLRINDLQPATTYELRMYAVNEVGRTDFSKIITVTAGEDVPSGPPQYVEVESKDAHTLRVTWKAPKKNLWNGSIRGYNIGYKIHKTNDSYVFASLEVPEDYTEDLIYQIPKLQMYTQYNVVVQAYNSRGNGPLSSEVIAMTYEDVPSKAPEGIRCSTLSSKSIYVVWDPPASETVNGILRGYKVLYMPTEEWHKATGQSKVSQAPKITLQGLEVNTNYSIQVLAYTKIGDGVRSDAIFCKTHEDVPQAPDSIKVLPSSSDSVMVSWKPIKKPHGIITKYNVYYKPLAGNLEDIQLSGDTLQNSEQLNKDATVYSSSADMNFMEIRGLKKNRKYAFWVTAGSVIGEGPSSRILAESVADSSVAAKSASFDDVIQTPWKRDIVMPCKGVGVPSPQRKWLVGDKAVKEQGRTKIRSDGALIINKVSGEDTGNYTCAVYNEYGRDEVKYTLLVQVPPSAPILDVVSKSRTTIQLQFKPGNNGGDEVKGYTLYYRRDNGPWESKDISSDHLLYTLEDLGCGATYQIYLEAYNSIGNGTPCEIISVTTEGANAIAPQKEDLLREGSSFVTVVLSAWSTAGCPISNFRVEYKKPSAKEWKLMGDKISPSQKKLVIPGLESATWYLLRITTQTSGGSSVSEYKFATHTVAGGTIAPDFHEGHQPVYIFYMDPYIFIPAVALLIVVIIASVIVCVFAKRRNGSVGTPTESENNVSSWNRRSRPNSGVFITSGHSTFPRRNNSDPSPYATAHISDCYPDNSHPIIHNQKTPSHQPFWQGYPASTSTFHRTAYPTTPEGAAGICNDAMQQNPPRGVTEVQETTFVFPSAHAIRESISSPKIEDVNEGTQLIQRI